MKILKKEYKEIFRELFKIKKDILNIKDKQELKNICFDCIKIYKLVACDFTDKKIKNYIKQLDKIEPLIIKENNLHKLRSYALASISMLENSKISKL